MAIVCSTLSASRILPLDNVTLGDDSYNIDDMLDKLSEELGANE